MVAPRPAGGCTPACKRPIASGTGWEERVQQALVRLLKSALGITCTGLTPVQSLVTSTESSADKKWSGARVFDSS